MTEIFGFMTLPELIQMQVVNKWMYNTAISRVQTRIPIRKRQILFPQPFSQITNRLIMVEPQSDGTLINMAC